MPATGGTPIRVAADLVAAAAIEGAPEGRSVEQQLDYWTRVGRAVCARKAAARRQVEAALEGTVALSELSREEAVAFNAEVQARIEQALRTTNLGAVLNASGISIVSLDDDDQMIERRPEGTQRAARIELT